MSIVKIDAAIKLSGETIVMRKKEDINKIRNLFKTIGEICLAINATDNEVHVLYNLQIEATNLYNQSVEIDERVKRMKKEIQERSPFRNLKTSL